MNDSSLQEWNSRGAEVGRASFVGSAEYWEQRYAVGGGSGVGSRGKLAVFKADVINRLSEELELRSAVEWGCGDGFVLEGFAFEQYLGLDVSPTVVGACRERFAERDDLDFAVVDEAGEVEADVALSLDVIFHLIEDQVFETYMRRVFGSARRCVIIYSNNHDDNHDCFGTHVRNRRFTQWIREMLPDWALVRRIYNAHPPVNGDYRTGSFSDFYIYLPVNGFTDTAAAP